MAHDPLVGLEILPRCVGAVGAGRAKIKALVARYAEKWAVLEYGVISGFGEFKNFPIALHSLEVALLRSLCAKRFAQTSPS